MQYAEDHVLTLFSFCYQPVLNVRDSSDGGFGFYILDNHTLEFYRYHTKGHILTTNTFLLPEGTIDLLKPMIDAQRWWINQFPRQLNTSFQPASRIWWSIAGQEQTSVDDILQVAQRPFNEQRGLNARRLLGLLENVANILVECGFYVTPCSFLWNERTVHKLQPTTTYDYTQTSQIG